MQPTRHMKQFPRSGDLVPLRNFVRTCHEAMVSCRLTLMGPARLEHGLELLCKLPQNPSALDGELAADYPAVFAARRRSTHP
jgi:hypothetical protein